MTLARMRAGHDSGSFRASAASAIHTATAPNALTVRISAGAAHHHIAQRDQSLHALIVRRASAPFAMNARRV